ncbi:ATP-binding cassette sub-family C member 12-like isoform X2 [Venturia canescens]|uniref:ATP-binding cassette sub-family C member 12-like isoform X2 n=1 Tax=Venturia canescens TaxID=32260 RepID=UPI001C9D1E2A|nr:ATP-binding cassette sub-family C member 12-like isoform X2 [Venturia canescens]
MSSPSYSYSRVEGSIGSTASMESGSQGQLYPRKTNDLKRNQHSSAYVPHDRLSRYATALANLTPVRFTRVPGSEMPLDKIGLCSSVSFSWLNEYISAGYKNGARDKAMPTLARLDSCQVNGTRIEGLWHTHVVKCGQAGASVPRIAWQFVRTRILVASFIYLLGLIISFCTPMIALQHLILATEHRTRLWNEYCREIPGDNLTMNSNQTSTTSFNKIDTTNATVFEIESSTSRAIRNSPYNRPIEQVPDSVGFGFFISEFIIYICIAGLIVAEVISLFLYSWSASMNLRTATRLRSACLAFAYKKLVRSSIRYEASAHQIMTYFVPSSKTLYELIANGPLIFSGPLIVVLWSLFMWYSMGHWALIGTIVLVALYLCLIPTAYLTKIFGTKAMNYSLQRMSLMQEFIDNVFLAKVTTWDNYFFKKVREVRKKEIAIMQLGGLSEGWSLGMVHIIPIGTMGAALMACILANQQFVAANYIPCLVLILINLKYCIRNSWLAMSSISRGIISLNKLKAVLTLKDTDRFTDRPIDKNLAVTINHGHFTWERDNFFSDSYENQAARFPDSHSIESLVDINFYAPKSKLIGICGSRGSGKTSLLLSLMGHLNIVSGRVTIDGSCSYVSQVPWLFEGTLKENILFGDSLDSSWYYKTIRSCNLAGDLALLPGSDDTDLSTVNLTLGQQQKIVLARAVYTQRDINLLDNPLADVEPEESKDIFEKSVILALGTKTVIMVSDKVQFLNRCDIIYVMKEGTIVEQGTHEELLQWNGEYTNLLDSYMKKYKKKYCKSGDQINTSMSQLLTTPGPRGMLSSTSTAASCGLEADEEMITIDTNEDLEAPTKDSVYEEGLQIRENFYIRTAAGSYLGVLTIIVSTLFSFPIAASPLVFIYVGQKTISDMTTIAIMISSMAGFLVFSLIVLLAMYNKMVFSAARRIHATWLHQLYRAQLSIFATIPQSILLNICSLNLQEVDSVLPRLMTTVLMHSGIVVFSVLILAFLSFWLLIPTILFILVSISYIVYARGLTLSLHKIIQTDSVVPIYNHSVNTIAGRAVIQAYHKERDFTKKFYKDCDTNSTFDFMLHAIKLWIEYRIKMWAALNIGTVVLICASLSDIRHQYEVLSLAFICTLQMTLSIVHLTEAFTSAYASLLAINAVNNFVESLPKEESCDIDLPNDWPYEHSIKLKNVELSTKSLQEPINISIGSGEKVALMGTEPTLKSSFVTSLYRFVEITSGDIYLSNTNINHIPTAKLRKSINFIPGDPFLFDGSVKYNLDPNNESTDKTLMMALQKVCLWEKVSKLPNKLESSANVTFKLWEKKLLFLARALLNNSSKILIIEESMEQLGSDEDIVETVLLEVFTDYTIIALSSRKVRYATKTYYIENGKVIEAPTVKSDFSGTNSTDVLLSVPKNIVQTDF